MDTKEKIEYWLELADYDIEVAQSLYNSKKYLYVGYFCHLIIEKTIKAYYWYITGTEPPYTHNLLLLSNKSELLKLMSNENVELLNILMPLNIEARYPKDKNVLFEQLTKSRIYNILSKTIDLNEWIKKLII